MRVRFATSWVKVQGERYTPETQIDNYKEYQ